MKTESSGLGVMPKRIWKCFFFFAVFTVRLFCLPEQGSSQSLRHTHDVEGDLEVVHEDGEQSRYQYFLNTGRERLELRFDSHAPALHTGERVRVRGHRRRNVITLASSEMESFQTLSAAILPNTFGPQKTLVILVNFPDSATPDFTVEDIQPIIETANTFFFLNSFGKTWLNVDIVGSFTINQSSTGCNYDATAALAEQAAKDHGVDLSLYTRFIYAFPHNACGTAGRGTVGGNPARSWIHQSLAPQTWIHEMGHNLGLFHSHMKFCDIDSCTIQEYGDWDIMGSSDQRFHFNPFQKERLGWLNYDDGVHTMPPITTITENGTYSIGTYESQNSDPKALKVLKSIDPDTGAKTYFYFEYRQPVFDNAAFGFALLHSGSEDDGNSSFLLDLKPLEPLGKNIFNVGDTYRDAAGATFTLLSQDRTGATIAIEVPPPCLASPPSVVLSPGGTQTVRPGESLSYTVTVTNNFGDSCGMSDVFQLSAGIPAGWGISFEDESLTIPPGQSASTSLEVTVSPTARAGSSIFFALTISNREVQNPVRTGINVTIPSCTRFNPTMTLTPSGSNSISAGNSALFSVTITNNNSAICSPTGFNLNVQAPSGWTATAADNSLTIAPGGTASTTVSLQAPAKLRSGSYTFSIDAADASKVQFTSANGTLVCCAKVNKLTIATMPNKKTYAVNEPVAVTVNVHSSKAVVPGANVSVSILQGGIVRETANTVTDESGIALVQFVSGAAPGKYQVATRVLLNEAFATGKASFSVK